MYDHSKPYAPLTADNAALILVDHQVGLMTGVRDYEAGELKHNVVALAKAAKALRIPTVTTTTARDSMWGPIFPELVEVVGAGVHHRSLHGQRLGRSQGRSRHRGDRPQEADLRRHLARGLRHLPGDQRDRQGL
jgi:hypothetical protein